MTAISLRTVRLEKFEKVRKHLCGAVRYTFLVAAAIKVRKEAIVIFDNSFKSILGLIKMLYV